ncbi:hypothetical protein [Streptomyces sp. NRRL F-5630]|uniref:hypothetical protein n=1 Tax=Streptomyces sp. NRRL F-5630 TaxID=1463864 RepID=UPI003D70FDFA
MHTLLTSERLSPYTTACSHDAQAALALYQWNSEMAAAFFGPLGHLEVMLRNALDARLVHRQQRRSRTREWYDDPDVPLGKKARADIRMARHRAERQGAATPRGKIIAELSFGFWRFLLARQYQTTLWPDLARAFPHAPSRALTLIEDPVARLHKFRNRVAHHESIWHLPLEARRDDLLAVLGFLAPDAAAWVTDTWRIDDVLSRRPLATRVRAPQPRPSS